MICCICGNKQSGWLSDFALSNEHPEFRICAKCHDKRTNMLSKIESEDFSEISRIFVESAQPNMPEDISSCFAQIIEKANAQHQRWEDEHNKIKHQELIKELENQAFQKKVDDLPVTTTISIEGFHIVRYIKTISGVSVLGTGIFSELKASVSDLFGVESEAFIQKIEAARESAETQIKLKAIDLDADAIIGVSVSFAPFAGNMIGIVITGTAVKLSPIQTT